MYAYGDYQIKSGFRTQAEARWWLASMVDVDPKCMRIDRALGDVHCPTDQNRRHVIMKTRDVERVGYDLTREYREEVMDKRLYLNRMYEKVIREMSVDRSDLKRWNMVQLDLWMNLISELGLDQNDPQAFFSFGKFFSDYVDEHGGEAPELQDVLIQWNPNYYK